ncbi:MAG: 4a-hydroxytetrahydrobiopterin dehydratase [Chloroflexi bacterium]|nr:4a-hydroxytetrahydrobiopterin dehydratase [Chloroflexota bacterium]
MEKLAQEQCVPCTGDVPKLSDAEIQELHMNVPMWAVADGDEGKQIERTYEFERYPDGLIFASRVGRLAEEQDHHPTIIVGYKKVTLTWNTHAIKGLHRNDFVMAAKSDETYLKLLDETRAKSVVQEASEESFPGSDAPGWIGSTSGKDAE